MTNAEMIALLRVARESLKAYTDDEQVSDLESWHGKRWDSAQEAITNIDAALAKHDTQKNNNVKNKRPAIQVPRGHDAKTCCCVDCCVSRSVR